MNNTQANLFRKSGAGEEKRPGHYSDKTEKTTLYLLRHCEPDRLKVNDLQQGLTEKGLEDAGKIAGFLSGRGISRIFSSDALRALQTVQVFADQTDLEISRDERLREGILGCAPEENYIYSPRQWEDPFFFLPGGESLARVQQRMLDVTRQILAECRGEKVLVCTHCTAMSVLMNAFDPSFGWEQARFKKRVWPWVVQMEFDGQGRFEKFQEIYPVETGNGSLSF